VSEQKTVFKTCHSERSRSSGDGVVEESRECWLWPCSYGEFYRNSMERTPWRSNRGGQCTGILRLARASRTHRSGWQWGKGIARQELHRAAYGAGL